MYAASTLYCCSCCLSLLLSASCLPACLLSLPCMGQWSSAAAPAIRRAQGSRGRGPGERGGEGTEACRAQHRERRSGAVSTLFPVSVSVRCACADSVRWIGRTRAERTASAALVAHCEELALEWTGGDRHSRGCVPSSVSPCAVTFLSLRSSVCAGWCTVRPVLCVCAVPRRPCWLQRRQERRSKTEPHKRNEDDTQQHEDRRKGRGVENKQVGESLKPD